MHKELNYDRLYYIHALAEEEHRSFLPLAFQAEGVLLPASVHLSVRP